MISLPGYYMTLITGCAAVVVWTIVIVRMLYSYLWVRNEVEHRRSVLVGPFLGLLASLGAVASAVAFAQEAGVIEFTIDYAALVLVAAMGRGALLMAAVISLIYFKPPHRKGARNRNKPSGQ